MLLRPPTSLTVALASTLIVAPASALSVPAADESRGKSTSHSRPLTGRFLQITDFHPDPFYKAHGDTSRDHTCHGGHGPAGYYGAETSGCDTPLSLVNSTFDWIRDNIRDDIDFIIWTGDSARHDNDEKHPRSDKQVVQLNELMVSKFREVFARSDDDDEDPTNDFIIPIIPTFGNNDILPHNIFLEGPNHWTSIYLDLWRSFIPEVQRHQFQRGGWFQVEAIPNKLAIFSLNTLYFFDSNSAVDGCAIKSEPGYEHMEWLRIQLQILRERGMKAILIGHVPPARTENKQSWDETCWQKYTLWMRQYRDVVITGLYGHMNLDHFQLQDFTDIKKSTEKGRMKGSLKQDISLDPEGDVSVMGASDYLMDLRNEWANLPSPKKSAKATVESDDDEGSMFGQVQEFLGWKKKKGKKHNDKFLEEIGGPWGERFSFSLVSPSIVPNYFPTMRVFEYNITDLEALGGISYPQAKPQERLDEIFEEELDHKDEDEDSDDEDDLSTTKKSKENNKKKHKKKKYKFTVPKAPHKSSPPGPAYSPQTLSLLGYTQYFANLTRLNNDTLQSDAYRATNDPGDTHTTTPTTLSDDYTWEDDADFGDGFGAQRWKNGKHHGKKPKHPEPHPLPFEFEVLYSTFNDSDPFRLHDLTARSYIDLARRIGNFNEKKSDDDSGKKHKKKKGKKEKKGAKSKEVGREGAVEDEVERLLAAARDWQDGEDVMNGLVGDNGDDDDDNYDIYETDDDANEDVDEETEEGEDMETEKKKKKKKNHRKKGHKHHVWYTFIERAFVGTMDRDEIQKEFGWIPSAASSTAKAVDGGAQEDVGLGDGEL